MTTSPRWAPRTFWSARTVTRGSWENLGGQQRRAARAVDAGGEGCGRDDGGVGRWGLSLGGPGDGGGGSEVGGLAVGEGVEDALEDRGAEFAWVEGERC